MKIKVGDFISFKCDVEQSAEVVEIKETTKYPLRISYIVKAPASGFDGDYIKGQKFAEIYADEIF